MGLLSEIYSASDGLKRKVRGLLDDPMGTIAQKINQFVHYSSIQASVKLEKVLRVGEQVEFELEPGKNGRTACVRVSGPMGAPVEGRPFTPRPPRDGSFSGDGNQRH